MTATPYRTNRDLFSNHYLEEHLPASDAWQDVSEDEIRAAYDDIRSLWDRERDTAPRRNEAQLEAKFIRPLFRKLGIAFEVEETVERGRRRPDYGFFASEDAASDAFQRRESGGDFYDDAVAVADAKRWGRPLDTRGERDFGNPSYQIHVYLQETPAQWAVLTNGKKWRLYYGPTSHRLDAYYEIDLPTLLADGDLADFRYFYLFFRQEAFLPDASGDCFLDDVYHESNIFARELGADLQDNVYEAIRVLAEGFLAYPGNDLDEAALDDLLPDDYEDVEEARLDLVHDAALVYLYRIIFVLYAESEGRDLLDTDNDVYRESYSLNALKQEIATERDGTEPAYRAWRDTLWARLDDLFTLIDRGSQAVGIPPEELSVPAYNGGLFRTDPDPGAGRESRFLARFAVGDAHLAEVLDLLTRSQDGDGKTFVDYSSLDIRHLGSIYEGLLEYELAVADEALALEDGAYVPADPAGEVAVEPGDVYLRTDSGERKATGSYYTPEAVVEYIVERTLAPLVDDITRDLAVTPDFADAFAERVFDLSIVDPAMGSGHFLTSAVDYLARAIVDAQERQAERHGVGSLDQAHDVDWARRQVAQRCLYGVDRNPLAVELAKVSLWLRTLAAEQPLAFLDHHLKTGNSLVGSDVDDVLGTDGAGDAGQLTLQESFDRTRRAAIEHVVERFQALLSIENRSLADVKEMEAAYAAVGDDRLYRRLVAMANVDTAASFGVAVPDDADERMARALRDEHWPEIEAQDWFASAQEVAASEHFFHWELEFPAVYFDRDGERRDQAGFDAVVGNPPYGAAISPTAEAYFGERYRHQDYQLDTYLLFMERGFDLGRDGGAFGMIVPNTWLSNLELQRIREYLFTETTLRTVRYDRDPVFAGVTVDTLSMIADNEPPDADHHVEIELVDDGVETYTIPQRRWADRDGAAVNVFERPAVAELGDKLREHPRLSEWCTVTQGTKPFQVGKGTPEQTREVVDAKPYVSDRKEGEAFRPLLSGRHVHRYAIDWDGDYWIEFGDWLAEPRYSANYDAPAKLLVRQTGDSLVATLDTEQFVVRDNLYTIVCECDIDLRYLLGLLNSSLLNWYYQAVLNPEEGEALAQVKRGHLADLPIHPPGADEASSERLCTLVDELLDAADRRQELNLSLRDYLGSYREGPALPDVGLFRPTDAGILAATATAYDGLRIGDVSAERDGETVTIRASARYKPADDGSETDRWGYTETAAVEAFALTDLGDTEAALVEAFVPVAVAEGDGFADFRGNATKTISLLDRLKAIRLPDPDDVAADLRRYREVADRAVTLEETIDRHTRRIDELVYDRYGLTDEEVDLVEGD